MQKGNYSLFVYNVRKPSFGMKFGILWMFSKASYIILSVVRSMLKNPSFWLGTK